MIAGLLGPEQDPGTGSVCAGSKSKQSWSLSRRREAYELPASEASRCCTCRRGAGELGSKTGTRGMLQASSWARPRVPGRNEQQKGVQEKTSEGGSLRPQPLSVTTSSVEQIYIKTIPEHKEGHKTRLLYRGARRLAWDRASGTRLYRSCRRHHPGSGPVSLWGCDPVRVPSAGSWECLQLVPSPCRLHVRGEVKCVAF